MVRIDSGSPFKMRVCLALAVATTIAVTTGGCGNSSSPQPADQSTASTGDDEKNNDRLMSSGTIYFSPENAMMQFAFEYQDSSDGEMIAGGFQAVGGKLEIDETTGEPSHLLLDVEASSVYTPRAELTPRLQSPEFFDVLSHPKIRFVSRKIQRVGDEGLLSATGELDFLGQKHSIVVPLAVSGDGDQLTVIAVLHLERDKMGMTKPEGGLKNEFTIRFEAGPKTEIEQSDLPK